MANYKISDLENLSGIKSHTIRIWEQRYGILEPHRTETNIRYYDDKHLRKLLNIVTLLDAGYKVSAVGDLTIPDIEKEIEKLSLSADIGIKEGIFINQLITAGLEYNEQQFILHFENLINTFGFIGGYEKVIYPMLQKIGMLWLANDLNPAQEHFISTLVKQKAYAAIDSLPLVSKSKQNWLLFMPENDHHDLGLIISSYILRKSGVKVCFLGADVPYTNVVEAANFNKSTHLLFFVVARQKAGEIESLQKNISKDFKSKTSIICCSKEVADSLPNKSNITKITSFKGFLDLIQVK
ncbi:MAG: MerR family transcriptional regulator [Vicingaceae bacterium]|nr:MerR family transcriptional regulator [Vicingaceae bacterium]